MTVSRLVLNHFRHFDQAEFAFSPGMNWIIGPNGAGKTAILESIYFLGTGKSHRSAVSTRLIQQGQDAFSVFAELQGEEIHAVGMSRSHDQETKIKLNQKYQANHLEVAKLLPVIMLHPEGFSLLTDGSRGRRSLMDFGVFYSEPLFYRTWSMAKRAVTQRNAALKKGMGPKVLQAFEEALIQSSEALDEYRSLYVEALKNLLQGLIGEFLSAHKVTMEYARGWSAGQTLKEALNSHLEQDLRHGFTSQGPHRADLKFRVGRTAVQEILSRGEQKLLICALKLAQGLLFQKQTGRTPVYLVDDLASELDAYHQSILLKHLETLGAQTFLTSIELPKNLAFSPEKIIEISKNNVKNFCVLNSDG